MNEAIFKRALVSQNPEAILEIAQVFYELGNSRRARLLRERAYRLRATTTYDYPQWYGYGFGEGSTSEQGAVIASSGRSLHPSGEFEALEPPPATGMYNEEYQEGDYFGEDVVPSYSDVRSPTSTRTEVRSPTSTRTEVRSPTSTSTEAYTRGNFTSTVTGGAGAGATTVHIHASPAVGMPSGTPPSVPGVNNGLHHGMIGIPVTFWPS